MATGPWMVVTASLLVLCLATPASVAAQEVERFEVSTGYTFLDSSEIVDSFGGGWLTGGAWNPTDWFALSVELNGSRQEQSEGFFDVEAKFLSFLVGPRLAISVGPLRPFAQVLAGGSRLETVVSSNLLFPDPGDFADTYSTFQIGGGTDIRIDRGFSVRVAFDYRRVFAPVNIHQRRFLTALVFGFPAR